LAFTAPEALLQEVEGERDCGGASVPAEQALKLGRPWSRGDGLAVDRRPAMGNDLDGPGSPDHLVPASSIATPVANTGGFDHAACRKRLLEETGGTRGSPLHEPALLHNRTRLLLLLQSGNGIRASGCSGHDPPDTSPDDSSDRASEDRTDDRSRSSASDSPLVIGFAGVGSTKEGNNNGNSRKGVAHGEISR
jgi:hypothetical protein